MLSITNYNQAAAFIESLSNISHLDRKTPTAAKERLARVRDFLDFLGNPEKKLKIIHIAGTSGKGSVATMLQSILLSAGKKTGCYTSPHTTTFCERIKVGDRFISERELVLLVNFLKDKMDEFVHPNSAALAKARGIRMRPSELNSGHSDALGLLGSRLSLNFFDFSFCLALLYFKKMRCEYAVIETGCGGRYDATNAIQKPIYTIITNIGRDHLDVIGPALKDIAYEKAGIVKRGAPLLTGEQDKRWLEIFSHELEKSTSCQLQITNYKDLKNINTDLDGTEFEYKKEKYKLKLLGEHQARNAALAIECADDLGIKETAIKTGLARAFYPARLEAVSKKPLIIIDGAHNEDKIKATINFIKTLKHENIKEKKQKKYLIIGMAKSKKIKKAIKELFDFFDKVYITRFSNPFRKAMAWNDWQKIAKNREGLYYCHYAKDALLDILPKLRDNDLLLITGSIFLAGELREYWCPEDKIIKFRKSEF